MTMELTIAPANAIPEGEGRTFDVHGTRVAVLRTRGGGVFAVQAACPHRGGPLAGGLVGGSTLVCPLHAWRFELTTGASQNGGCSLQTFPVRIDGADQIVLTWPVATT